MRVDLNQQLMFPREIATTSLWPDVVLWSTTVRAVIMVEFTVPWEEGMEAEEGEVQRADCCMHRSGLEGTYLPTR